jgi:hypothetical protein
MKVVWLGFCIIIQYVTWFLMLERVQNTTSLSNIFLNRYSAFFYPLRGIFICATLITKAKVYECQTWWVTPLAHYMCEHKCTLILFLNTHLEILSCWVLAFWSKHNALASRCVIWYFGKFAVCNDYLPVCALYIFDPLTNYHMYLCQALQLDCYSKWKVLAYVHSFAYTLNSNEKENMR